MTYYDLGKFGRRITTSSPEAQLWFDRGLAWVYAFNHEESVKCFHKALEHDPDCAMAHWGVAYASGPNYNVPWELMDPNGKAKALAAAFDATKKALASAAKATPVEQALITALPVRFPQRDPPPKDSDDTMVWDKAYTRAMRDIFRKHGADLDVRCLFVDAIMNETPWQMWNLETGKPTEGAETLEAMAVLDEAFETDAAVVEPSRPAASLRPPDRDVAVPAACVARRRPAARAGARFGPPGAHADPHRRAVRQLQRRHAVEPEGRGRRPQVRRARRRDELLHALSRPQSSLRDLRRDVPGPVHAGHRGRAGTDRHHARGAA